VVSHAAALRELFAGLNPVADDLLLLEPHEISEMLDRVAGADLAAVLHDDARLLRYLRVRCPDEGERLDALLREHGPLAPQDRAAAEAAVVWEVADLIAYERAPQLYEQRAAIPFVATAVTSLAPLEDALVVDAGAGTGRVALALALQSRLVVAVEPAGSLRRHLRMRARQQGLTNVLVAEGALDALPLPDGCVDVLVTCHAIGWRLAGEITEIDRVLAPGGTAVHLFAQPPPDPVSRALTAAGYRSDVHVAGGVTLWRLWGRR
jgi:SAM-dependent methyltransferase